MSDPPKPPPTVSAPATAASDDEFAGVRARRTRHPVLALAATLLVAYLVFHVRADIRYSLSSKEPLEMGDARALFASGRSLDDVTNRYVRVRGVPDRESALELDTKGSWTFTQFFRVLGTGGRLFVHRRETPVPAFRVEEDVFEGRLIRFKDLSFESSIRRYFASHVTSTHFFPAEALRSAIGASPGGAITIRDVGGEAVTLAPNDLVAVDVTDPDLVRIGIPRARFPEEGRARAEIEKRGGTVVAPAPPGAAAPPADEHAFLVRFPVERRQMALHEIGDIDRRVQIRDVRRTHKVRLVDLADGGDSLLLKESGAGGGAPTRIPLATVPAIRTLATVQIPDDAYLLIESDHPRDHLHIIAVVGVLVLFAAVNLGGLLRGLRR